MKRLLWVGDAACPSGFARATHGILDQLCFEYEITVLGLNYRGDPHEYAYPIYAAAAGGDGFGLRRLHQMCHIAKPDVIVIQQDGWNIQDYVDVLRARKMNGEYHFPEHASIPIVAMVAVDGKNFRAEWLNGVTTTIFWTQFALDEARESGFAGVAHVIPLGVDTALYHPIERNEALRYLKLDVIRDRFIVGSVNRNQPRKRWDLTLRLFARWVKTYQVTEALLYLHAAPTGDMGIDVKQLAKYYGIDNMLALREPAPFEGISDAALCATYNTFDLGISTTQGEGFGLTTLEAMACGVPSIVPDWSGLGDWARSGASMIPCPTTAVGPPYVNVLGGIVDEEKFVKEMQRLYASEIDRAHARTKALACARDPRYTWASIGDAWRAVLADLLEQRGAA